MKRIVALILALAVLVSMITVSAGEGVGVLIRRVRAAQYYGDTTMLKAFRTDGEVDSNTVWEICENYTSGMRVWKRLGVGPCLTVKLDREAVNCAYRCRLSDGTTSWEYLFTDITERPAEPENTEEVTDETVDGESRETASESLPEATEQVEEITVNEETTEQGNAENIPAETEEQTEETVPEVTEEELAEEAADDPNSVDETEEQTIEPADEVNKEPTEEDPETETAEEIEVEDEMSDVENAEEEVNFIFESIDEIEKLLEEIEFIETPEDLNALMTVPEGTSMLLKPLDGSDEVILLPENTVVRVVALSTEWAMIEILAGDEVTYTGYVRKETIKLLPTKEPLPTPVTWVESETPEKENDGVAYEGETMYLCVDASVYENLVRISWQCDYGIRGNWQDIPGGEGNRYPIVVNSKNVNYLYRVMLTIDD